MSQIFWAIRQQHSWSPWSFSAPPHRHFSTPPPGSGEGLGCAPGLSTPFNHLNHLSGSVPPSPGHPPASWFSGSSWTAGGRMLGSWAKELRKWSASSWRQAHGLETPRACLWWGLQVPFLVRVSDTKPSNHQPWLFSWASGEARDDGLWVRCREHSLHQLHQTKHSGAQEGAGNLREEMLGSPHFLGHSWTWNVGFRYHPTTHLW